MESSQFSNSQFQYEGMEPMATQGTTCDTFRVKLYGKLHFLKRLKPEFAGDVRYHEALRKEFETGYQLEHPNLVRYISLDNNSILMEYVDGETLSHYLANRPDFFKNRKNVDKFVRQLLDVVGYLHSHHVLHLDLKPDNILLTRIGSDVKLVDLGCSYTDSFPDTTGHTNAFASPEQLTGLAVDARSDIYAIGKILERLPNHYIYNKVIARCTAERPAGRYQSVEEMRLALSPRSHLWHIATGLCVATICACSYIFLQGRYHSAEPQNPPLNNDTAATSRIILRSEDPAAGQQPDGQPPQQPPVSDNISQEEKEFLSQPHLHVATDDEFTQYKHLLDDYYAEANRFLDDTANLRLFPSHNAYVGEYQRIIYQTREKMMTDDWFFPLYNSPMNPISVYTRKYKDSLEHKAFVNSNLLP